MGDFDADSHPDLVVASGGGVGTVSVLLGDGSGGYGPATRVAAGDQPRSVAVGHFNRDEDLHLDLAVAKTGSGSVSVLLGNGDGSFGSATNYQVGSDSFSWPLSVVARDFNSDSNSDLAVANFGSDNVSVLLSDGDGGFGAATNYPVGDRPTSVAVGDFDRSGVPDLAVANAGSDNVSVLLGRGTGTFDDATSFAAGDGPSSVAVGFFDGDAWQDLAVANRGSDNVSVLLGGDRGSFGSATDLAVGDAPASVAVGDFDDDLDPDLAVANEGSGDVSVLLNNDAPDAVDDTYAIDEDTSLTVAAAGVLGNDTDGDGDHLEAVLESGPAHGNLDLADDGSFSYTPDPDYNGEDSFSYRASDGGLDSGTATVTIDVKRVADAPVANDDTYETDEDTPLTVNAPGVLANDSDGDGDSLKAVRVLDLPVGGNLRLNDDGSLTYTPRADSSGGDSFHYLARDRSFRESRTATVRFDVKAVDDAPAARGDAYTTDEDTPLAIDPRRGVLANDSDVEGAPLAALLVSAPQHGSLELREDGSLSYRPERAYNGTDSFVYKANDGELDSDPVTVTLDVGAVADAPAAAADAYETDEDTPLSVDAPGVLANDNDPDGHSLAAALVAGPTHGSLTLDADGSFSYTPNPDYNGTDSFSYRASDGSLDSDPVTVSFEVRPVDDTPPAGPDSTPPAGTPAGQASTPPAAGQSGGSSPAAGPGSPGGPLPGSCANAKSGSAGRDRLMGGAFGDRLLGLAGNDVLIGRAGDDCLNGGPGNDRLGGGPGRDRLSGGGGNDTINSRDRRRETVRCGKGAGDRVRADRSDRLIGCERVTSAR